MVDDPGRLRPARPRRRGEALAADDVRVQGPDLVARIDELHDVLSSVVDALEVLAKRISRAAPDAEVLARLDRIEAALARLEEAAPFAPLTSILRRRPAR